MTTLRQIIIDAHREAGVTASGEVPDADQLVEAMDRLNNIIKRLFGNELGERLQSINLGIEGLTNSYAIAEDETNNVTSVYIPSNVRLMLNLSTGVNLYLPPNPQDGARVGVIDNAGNLSSANLIINGNGRKIESADSVTLSTDGLKREWFYRADLGDWTRIIDLVIGDESPLPSDFDDLLITLLAFRLNPRYGAETSQNMAEVMRQVRSQLRARYRQVVEIGSEDGIVILPSNPYSRINTSF